VMAMSCCSGSMFRWVPKSVNPAVPALTYVGIAYCIPNRSAFPRPDRHKTATRDAAS
jgi:hypothetical protein